MRTCAYDGGGGQIFVILVRTYYLNDPHGVLSWPVFETLAEAISTLFTI